MKIEGTAKGKWTVPANWPTQRGDKSFWEELGRTVATFGMLEDTIPRALYVITGQENAKDGDEGVRQIEEWSRDMTKNLSATLGALGGKLRTAWEERDGELRPEYAEIVEEISSLSKERNRLCHGAWIAFAKRKKGTVRYFPRGQELTKSHRSDRSLSELRRTRRRVLNVIRALRTEVRVTCNAPFPGAGEALGWEDRHAQ